MDRAVGRRGHPDVEEGARSRAHLGVVRGQDHVGLGALQDGGHHCGHSCGLGQSQAGIVQLGHELVVLGPQWPRQRLRRPGVDGGQLPPGRGGDGRELSQGGHPLGAGRVGSVQDIVDLGQERCPHGGHRAGRGAEGTDRTELPADHRHDGDRREQRGREIGRGAGELGSGRVEQVRRTRRGELARGQVGLDLLQAGQSLLVMAVRRPGPHRQESDPGQDHHRRGGDDQPSAPPPTDSLAHGNHSITPGIGPRGLGTTRSEDRRGGPASEPSMVPEPWRDPWSIAVPAGPRGSPAARSAEAVSRRTGSIPACRSRPSGSQSVG